ncbi:MULTISPECIES: class I SAM-dependent methyltransferase [Streptomyces]|uniref:Class I SAM-dependent methyltransferase n=1 Tax=Streptomyces solicathayae TaxID=3081768 RepID=A0ABZ0LN62_9ACTN|nr:class I SAM-dependent methyltransferase [Streptomyces sp. HUAS YS2]WOX20936.1 class I SAM-dependent methyltransferase [Streptomyces sp. HUAS YS2]
MTGRPAGGPAGPSGARRNREADWNAWPVGDYLAENYRQLHPVDRGVIAHHSAFYRQFPPGTLARSLEFGAGPNLYPLMLAAGASRRIDALEPSDASVAYLRAQLTAPDASWEPFWAVCRGLDPSLPERLTEALARVRVVHADARSVPAGTYDAASMNFVAESVTEDAGEFRDLCGLFIRSVRPGGRLVAAFMENMPSYRIGTGPRWPAIPVDEDAVRAVFAPHTEELRITRLGKDRTLPEYGDSGVVLLRATRTTDGPDGPDGPAGPAAPTAPDLSP